MYQALGFDVGVTFGTLNNLLKQKIWNTAVQTITHIWKMDQYTMYLLFPVRRYQSMMTFIRLSDWWILTFSIEDCTPANAPLLRKMEEISCFCHICKRICLYLMMCVIWNESKQELIDICLYDLFKYRICYIQILSIRPHFR